MLRIFNLLPDRLNAMFKITGTNCIHNCLVDPASIFHLANSELIQIITNFLQELLVIENSFIFLPVGFTNGSTRTIYSFMVKVSILYGEKFQQDNDIGCY